MGVKQSKIDGIYLPESPAGLKNFRYFTQTPKPLVLSTDMMEMPNLADPRSPSGDRTPISLEEEETFTSKLKLSMPAILRKKLFKVSNYNLNDPRSPSVELNRTPMVFEDGTERGLSLDDTFADLLVETRAPSNDSQTTENTNEGQTSVNDVEVKVTTNEEEASVSESGTSVAQKTAENHSLSFISMASEDGSAQEHTPIVGMLQQPLDPRSPTFGLERTPIVLTDDMDDDQLDQEMENMLEKLSLHINAAAEDSLISLGVLSVSETDDHQNKISNAPTNKHLERVRAPKKPARSRRSNADTTMSPVGQIYEDCENIAPKTTNIKVTNEDIIELGKRTPLSCVGNKEPRLRNINKMHNIRKNKHALAALNLKLNKSKDSSNEIFLEA